MKSTPDIAITDVAHSLLLRLMRNHPNHSTSLAELLSGNLEQAPSRFLLASQIESCQDAAAALALFQQALRQRSADEAVYVAVAKCLARCGDVPAAFAHIDLMLQGGMDLDKYSLSFLLRLCGETNDADRVVRYIRLCVRQYPQLLTRAVWNKVFSVLHSPSGGDAELAARLLTETLDAAPRCISHVHRVLVASAVRTLDAALQEELGNATATSSNGTARAKEIAATASDLLLSLCRALKQEGTSGRPLGSVVHPFAFNDVLRMLDAAGSADRVPSVFRAMSDEYNVSGGSESDQLLHPVENNNMLEWSEKAPNESGTVSLPAAAVKVWRPSVQQGQFRPSNYTITALVRNGRQRNDVGFIAEALRWSLERKVAIPFYAISDALSYLYRYVVCCLVRALLMLLPVYALGLCPLSLFRCCSSV